MTTFLLHVPVQEEQVFPERGEPVPNSAQPLRRNCYRAVFACTANPGSEAGGKRQA